MVLRPGRVSDNMAAILKNGNDPAKSKIDSLMTQGSPRGKFGKFARADGNSQTLYTLCRALSPCSVWCRRSSRSTRSLTGRLSASLSLGSASTRRSLASSGRCWTCRRLAMVADKGARWQGTGCGYIVSCALRRLKHALVPVLGSNAIRIFKRCCPQTRDAH